MKYAASVVLTVSMFGLADAMNLDLFDPKTVVAKTQFESSAHVCKPVDVEELRQNGLLTSQDFEDECMLSLFDGMCGGRYMEMGALDGVKFSNTYAFYKSALNWRGVMVELIPDNYEKLIQNRPDEFANIHGAVCSEPTTLHYYPGNNNAVGGILEFASESHKHRWFDDIDIEDTTPISCTPLQNILDVVYDIQNDKIYFDFFSLDIEGAEMSALNGIDWERTGFGILIVEKNDPDVEPFLKNKGYNLVHLPGCSERRNNFYINPQFDAIYNNVRAKIE